MDKNCTLKQIWHVADLLKQIFCDLCHPLQQICIDGRPILWKPITVLKQYTSAKWHIIDIKLFKACNVNSTIINIINDTKTELDEVWVFRTSQNVVTTWLEQHLNQQITACGQMVQQASIIPIFVWTKHMCCGTVWPTRDGMPVFKEKTNRGNCKMAYNGIQHWDKK